MCRLFGMSGGREPVSATFWLLEAPDSLAAQSRREPDGTGLGRFDRHDQPVIDKQPVAAYDDQDFAREAREVNSRTFVAHVRYASNGGLTVQNTHPFEQSGRLFAHNGVIGDVPALERELGGAMSLVSGETDSERFFALITSEIARCGDIGEGIATACHWVAEHLPVLSLNFILITPEELWALRYPDTHELHLLERRPGGPSGARHLEQASARGSIRVRAGDLRTRAAVIVASECMDEDAGWRAVAPGELLHVGPGLSVHRRQLFDGPPAHLLTLADLDPKAAASQQASART
ncbi:MAG: class II glutamine amidotransferase [Solirubrobacteraceae bacterium]